jgi:hypothetical protein
MWCVLATRRAVAGASPATPDSCTNDISADPRYGVGFVPAVTARASTVLGFKGVSVCDPSGSRSRPIATIAATKVLAPTVHGDRMCESRRRRGTAALSNWTRSLGR